MFQKIFQANGKFCQNVFINKWLVFYKDDVRYNSSPAHPPQQLDTLKFYVDFRLSAVKI